MILPGEIHWQQHVASKGNRAWLPALTVWMGPPGAQAPRLFLVDTGASLSVAPAFWALDLLDPAKPRPSIQDSGLRDAHGAPLVGFALAVELELRSGTAQPFRLQETIWFCRGIHHGLLGQTTFLEQMGALFLNFPSAPEGRRFGLFRRVS